MISRRRIIAAAVAVTSLVGGTALLHTPAGRALLGKGGCPWGGRAASPTELEDFRVKSSATLRGSNAAASRPAMDFVIESTTRSDVDAWATREGMTCKNELGGAALRCERAGAKEGRESDFFFRFNPGQVLVGLDVMHAETNDVEKASSLVESLASKIEKTAGPASTSRGVPARSSLANGYLAQVAVEFRFTNYAADISATNFGERGIVVREQYRAVSNAEGRSAVN